MDENEKKDINPEEIDNQTEKEAFTAEVEKESIAKPTEKAPPSFSVPTKKPNLVPIISAIAAAVVIIAVVLIIVLGGSNGNNGDTHTHSFSNWTITKNATCKDEGEATRSCECGEIEKSKIDKVTTHTEAIDPKADSTCKEKGKTEGKHCSVCGFIILEQTDLPLASHTYDNADDEKCNICGFVRDVNCEHSITIVLQAVSPTCTTSGLSEGKKCSACDEILVAQTTIKETGHNEIIDSAITATCEIEGKTEGKHCSICNTVTIKQTSLGYAPHNYQNGVCLVCRNIDQTFKNAEIEAENERHEARIKEIEDAYLWLVQTNEERIAELKTQHNISYVYDNLTCYEKVSALETDIADLSQKIARLEIYNDPSDLATIASLKNQKKSKEAEKAKYEAMISIHRYEDAILSHTDSYNSDVEKENALNETNLSMIDKKYDCYKNKHNVITITGNGPTCENVGVTDGLKCQTCNIVLVKQVEIPATGHTSNDETGKCGTCGANLFEAGLVFTLNNSGTGYIVSDYTGTNSTITIPDLYKGLPVVAIGDYAFYKCNTIENISLPESIVSIGECAFYWCEKLQSIIIGENVQYIGNWAFHYCISLESIDFNAIELTDLESNNYLFTYAGFSNNNLTVTIGSNVKRIPNNLFNPGEELYIRTVVFENNSKCLSIGQQAFLGCSTLTTLTLPDSLTNIEMFAFSNCTGLKNLVIPDSVTGIEYGAFQSCSNLESVHIGIGVKNVGSYAFGSCDKLSKVYIKDLKKWCNISFEHFGSNPLNCSTLNCENELYLNDVLVTKITIPEGVEMVGDFVFERCYDVTEVVISDGVKTIGKYAFRACTAMTTLTISSTVTKIDEYAFYYCTSLSTIRFEGTIEQWNNISLGSEWCNNISATTVICDDGNVTLRK